MMTLLAVRVVAPVPPLTTESVDEAVIGEVPPPMRMSPLDRVAAPVPPRFTARVVVEVRAEESPPDMTTLPAGMLSRVRESVILTVPLKRVVPRTPKVVLGEAVPTP